MRPGATATVAMVERQELKAIAADTRFDPGVSASLLLAAEIAAAPANQCVAKTIG